MSRSQNNSFGFSSILKLAMSDIHLENWAWKFPSSSETNEAACLQKPGKLYKPHSQIQSTKIPSETTRTSFVERRLGTARFALLSFQDFWDWYLKKWEAILQPSFHRDVLAMVHARSTSSLGLDEVFVHTVRYSARVLCGFYKYIKKIWGEIQIGMFWIWRKRPRQVLVKCFPPLERECLCAIVLWKDW